MTYKVTVDTGFIGAYIYFEVVADNEDEALEIAFECLGDYIGISVEPT